ncbi:16S rRNA (guanine(966)-N(2))-methyltransferase RsmD [Treponema sp. R6D11]
MLGKLKISRGKAKGKSLYMPDKTTTRPTSNKIRQAVLNIIQFELEDARVLDLFAGSGAFGLEALSAGAAFCDFVDVNTKDIIQKNLKLTELNGRVHPQDFKKFLSSCNKKYDIIFLDPPYETDYVEEALALIDENDLAKKYIICETNKQEINHNFKILSTKKYGEKNIFVLTRSGKLEQ